jgi:hypothetical protein
MHGGWDSGISIKFQKVSREAKQNLHAIDNVVEVRSNRQYLIMEVMGFL